MELPLHYKLGVAETPQTHAYFMLSGMCSVVATMQDGTTAEVAVIGCEGVVGSLDLLGPAKAPTDSFIQITGAGLKIPIGLLRKTFRSSEEIRSRILEFNQVQAMTSLQMVGCNRLHSAEERLARWLLMAQDRVQSETLDLTQEFLAMMLGSRRTTVTLVAGTLQRAGLIEYTRGRLTIKDRRGLERVSCDCYAITESLLNGLYREAFDPAD